MNWWTATGLPAAALTAARARSGVTMLGPDRGDEVVGTARAGPGGGLVPAPLQEPAPRLGTQGPSRRQVGLGWRVGRRPRPPGVTE